jgi:hypothetical protein
MPPLLPSRRIILPLLLTAILLPIAVCVVIGVAALLGGMGDSVGEGALHWVALIGGILWIIDLICLVLLLAVAAMCGPDRPEE